ncbi:MAG TPA: glycosyltransferase, partial [bacterium]|nr:glycosyltransferase [bacterium]
ITISQVAACLKISDLTLVYYSDKPVNHHRASMKLREALACGRPVIATNVGESVHLKDSVVLSDANPAAFSKAIVKTLKSKRTVSPSAALLKKWDWKDCVKELEKELLKK